MAGSTCCLKKDGKRILVTDVKSKAIIAHKERKQFSSVRLVHFQKPSEINLFVKYKIKLYQLNYFNKTLIKNGVDLIRIN